MPKPALVGVALLLLLVGCSLGSSYPQDEAILQLSQTGGLVAGWDEQITVWGNGRVAVLSRGKPYVEFHLDRDALASIVNKAMLLYDLDSKYSLRPEYSDLGYSFFTVRTNRGRKTVSVYGMSLKDSVFSGGNQKDMEKLHSIYRLVAEAMPPDLPAMIPNKVAVTAMPFPCQPTQAEDWPLALLGRLEGDLARQAIEAGSLGSGRCFILNGRTHLVEVQPLLPLLGLPSSLWPEDGLPAPLWATAYNADGEMFEAPDLHASDLARFYRVHMPEGGWRLAKESGHALQVWVRQKYSNDPIVLIQFQDGRFSLQQLRVENGVPTHPDGVSGACEGLWCQLVRGATVEKAESWFREYMGFLGWRETAPNTYVRGDRQVRLEFRQTDEGVEVTQLHSLLLPDTWPPPPTPTPRR